MDKDTGTGTVTGAENQQDTGAEKTFTQAEVDNIVGERLNREKAKYPSKEELADYRNWKQARETGINNDLAKANNDLKTTKVELALYKSKAKGEFVEFLVSKISAMDGDFTKNTETFKAENPQYFETELKKRVASSPKLGGGTAGISTNEAMNNVLRGIK